MEGDLLAAQDPIAGGDFVAAGGNGGVCMAGALGGDGRSTRTLCEGEPRSSLPSKTCFAEQLLVGCERARDLWATLVSLRGNLLPWGGGCGAGVPSDGDCRWPAGKGGNRADALPDCFPP